MIAEKKKYIECFSCKAKSLNIEGESHEYMLSSPGCWAMFCDLLEKEYSDFRYGKAHHFTVDAYACQHPGKSDDDKAVRSVGIHLASLYMTVEGGMDATEGGFFKNKFAHFNKQNNIIKPLHPPSDLGSITVFDIWNMEEGADHFQKCKEWAKSSWQAWYVHHDLIKKWVHDFMKQASTSF